MEVKARLIEILHLSKIGPLLDKRSTVKLKLLNTQK